MKVFRGLVMPEVQEDVSVPVAWVAYRPRTVGGAERILPRWVLVRDGFPGRFLENQQDLILEERLRAEAAYRLATGCTVLVGCLQFVATKPYPMP